MNKTPKPFGEFLVVWQDRRTIRQGTTVITRAGNTLAPYPSLVWDGRQLSGVAPDGAYHYILTLTATNGQSSTTPPQPLTIDTSPPAAPTITDPAPALTYTPSALRLVAGTAPPELMVTLYSSIFTKAVQADASGYWEMVFPLQNGVNDLRAVATDRAGQVSPPSARKRIGANLRNRRRTSDPKACG